jgi:hypothetical protein
VATRAEQKKQQKAADRRRKLAKARNVRRNNTPSFRYKLEVKIGGEWCYAKKFSTPFSVKRHIEEVNELRKRGDVEIVEGRILDVESGRQVAHIDGYTPEEVGPSATEAAATPLSQITQSLKMDSE